MGIFDWFKKEKRDERRAKRESTKEYARESVRLETEVAAVSRKINELDEKMIAVLVQKGMTREQALESLKKNKLIP